MSRASLFRNVALILLLGAAGASVAAFQEGNPRELLARRDDPAPIDLKKAPADPEPVAGDIVYAAGYSTNGKHFACFQPSGAPGDGKPRIALYDTAGWQVLRTLTGPTATCRGIVFSLDGHTVFAACDDGKVYTWDVRTGDPGMKLEANSGACGAIARSPDGKLIATAHQGTVGQPGTSKIQLWDAGTGKPGRSFSCADELFCETITFTPSGAEVAGAYNAHDRGGFDGVIEWDVATGHEVRRIAAPKITEGAHPIMIKIMYARDGKQLIVGGGEAVPIPLDPGSSHLFGYLWVLDRVTGKLERTLIEKRQDYVRTVVLSPDGQKLFAGTYTPTRSFVQDGQLVTLNPDTEIQCWDTTKWQREWIKVGKLTNHWALVPSPDGKRLGVSTTLGYSFLDTADGGPKGGLVKTWHSK